MFLWSLLYSKAAIALFNMGHKLCEIHLSIFHVSRFQVPAPRSEENDVWCTVKDKCQPGYCTQIIVNFKINYNKSETSHFFVNSHTVSNTMELCSKIIKIVRCFSGSSWINPAVFWNSKQSKYVKIHHLLTKTIFHEIIIDNFIVTFIITFYCKGFIYCF